MSFINWGHETPEQKAFRRRMEERALIENAMMRKVFEARGTTSAATSAGASGSGLAKPSAVGSSTAYVYEDLDGVYQIGFIDYALKRFTKVFNTGLDTENTWQYDNNNYAGTYPVDGKGYAIIFSNIANDHRILFFTAGGTLIDTIDVNTQDLSIESVDGKWIILSDSDAQKVWWFDGEALRYDFDTFTDCLSWGYNGQHNLDGFFMYHVREENDGVSHFMNRVFINDGTGFRVIIERDFAATQELNYVHRAYPNSNILRVATYNVYENEYIKLEYFDSDSNSLNDYDISGNSYGTWFSDCYGTGKHIDTFVSASTYHIKYCDSVRQIYLTTNHDKTNYPDFFVLGTYIDGSAMYDATSETALVCFNDNQNGYDHDLVLVDYCDFMPMSDIMEDLNYIVTFADDETKMFGRNLISVSESIFIPQCTDVAADPKMLGMFFFSSAGGTGYSPLAGFDTFTFIGASYAAGTKYILTIGTDGPNLSPGKSFIFNEDGNSYKEDEWLDVDNNNLLFDYSGDVLVIRSSNDSSNQSYYYNNANDDAGNPVSIDPFGSAYTPTPYTTIDKLAPSKVVLQGGNSYRIFLFNDVGDNDISDGGNDMYDDGNVLYSGIAGQIPYTHTQMDTNTYSSYNEAPLAAFTSDGVVADGDSYFGGGSEYFTNMYPGLFVCVAKNIDVDSFGILGGTGVDDSGYNNNGSFPLTIGGTDYTVFYKTTTGSGRNFDGEADPTINQIIIIDSQNSQAIQTIGDTTDDDLHEISELVASGATEVHYLLLSTYNQSVQIGLTEEMLIIATAYLNLVEGLSIAATRTTLNQSYSSITSIIDTQDTYWLGLITSDNYTQIDSPFFNQIRVGPDLIAGVYFNDANKVCINLYNNDLQLITTHVTEDSNWNSIRVIGNRAYLRSNNGGDIYTLTILDPTKFTKTQYASTSGAQFDSNDYVNWC